MIVIGGNKYEVPAPKGMRSFSLQQRILPVAGRVANVFLHFSGSGDLAKLADMDVMRVLPQAMPYVGQVFSEMPPGELEWLTRELLQDALVSIGGGPKIPLFGSGGGDVFDSVMQGKAMDAWQLLWHALGVWYPDFFSRVRASIAKSAQASPSAESTTSLPSGPAGV